MRVRFINCGTKQNRRWTRHTLVSPIPVVVYGDDQLQIDARSSVIGEGGISLFAIAELPVGMEVEMIFTYSHSAQPIRMRGAVRNRAAYLFGIEFLVHSAMEQLEFARLRKAFSKTVEAKLEPVTQANRAPALI